MRGIAAIFALVACAGPAAADAVEDALTGALEAWRGGDAAGALEELDFARALIGARKAEGLAAVLPAPLPGWTREDADSGMGAAAAMFGGGTGAAATYRRGADDVTVEVMTDSPMVAALGAVMANPALAGMQGSLRRKGRQSYIVDPAGDVSALIEGRTLLRVTGGAPAEDKLAYFEAVDLERLGRD
jgi:hypothetical protein